MPEIPQHITVEVVSSAEVKRLEARDEELRSEIARVEGKLNALHRSMYELMAAFSELKSKR